MSPASTRITQGTRTLSYRVAREASGQGDLVGVGAALARQALLRSLPAGTLIKNLASEEITC